MFLGGWGLFFSHFIEILVFLAELMLLGLISLLLAQSARWISEICVNSSLFTSKFYICSEKDYSNTNEKVKLESSFSSPNATDIPAGLINLSSHQCGEVKCFANVDSKILYACVHLPCQF